MVIQKTKILKNCSNNKCDYNIIDAERVFFSKLKNYRIWFHEQAETKWCISVILIEIRTRKNNFMSAAGSEWTGVLINLLKLKKKLNP